jgi:hypothetical protein
LLAHTRRFIGVSGCEVTARWSGADAADGSCVFVLRTEEGVRAEVWHRSAIFLQSGSTSKVLAPNEGDTKARSNIVAKWDHLGEWQRLVIEKPLRTAVNPCRPPRQSIARLPKLAAPRRSAARMLRKMVALSLKHRRIGRKTISKATSCVARTSTADSVSMSHQPLGAPAPQGLGDAGNADVHLLRVPQGTPERNRTRREESPRRRSAAEKQFRDPVASPQRVRFSGVSLSGDATEAPCWTGTPCRRRRSSDENELEELAALATPTRRRRISAPHDLLCLLHLSPAPSPAPGVSR